MLIFICIFVGAVYMEVTLSGWYIDGAVRVVGWAGVSKVGFWCSQLPMNLTL